MAWGLALAAVGAILGWSRTGYASGFSDPKLLLVLAGVVAAWVWRRGPRKTSALTRPAALYGLSWLPSLAASRDFGRSLLGFPGVYTGSVLAAAAGAVGAILAERLQAAERVEVRRWILWAGLLTALLCVYQAGRADPFLFALPKDRAVGLLGSPIDAGALFVALLAVAPWATVPLFLAGLWATGSRGAMLGAVVSLLPVRARAGAAAAAAVVGLAWATCHPYPDASDQGRRALWTVAAQHVSLLGTGPVTFLETFEAAKPAALAHYRQAFAHNAILEAATTRGAAGVLGLLAILAAPRLAGLWVVAMFNPISFEVSFVACVLAGLYPAHHERELA